MAEASLLAVLFGLRPPPTPHRTSGGSASGSKDGSAGPGAAAAAAAAPNTSYVVITLDAINTLCKAMSQVPACDVPGMLAIVYNNADPVMAAGNSLPNVCPVALAPPYVPPAQFGLRKPQPTASVAVPNGRWMSEALVAAGRRGMKVEVDLTNATATQLQNLAAYVDRCTQGTFKQPVCEVCKNQWCEDPIVVCHEDTCTNAVHEACAGRLRRNANGSWQCWKCRPVIPASATCAVCTKSGGLLKATTQLSVYVHMLCAIMVPEFQFSSNPTLEPVAGMDKIPARRFNQRCRVCSSKDGICLACSWPHCKVMLHPRCAQQSTLILLSKTLRLYCPRHAAEQAEDSSAAEKAAKRAASQKKLKAQSKKAKTAADEADAEAEADMEGDVDMEDEEDEDAEPTQDLEVDMDRDMEHDMDAEADLEADPHAIVGMGMMPGDGEDGMGLADGEEYVQEDEEELQHAGLGDDEVGNGDEEEQDDGEGEEGEDDGDEDAEAEDTVEQELELDHGGMGEEEEEGMEIAEVELDQGGAMDDAHVIKPHPSEEAGMGNEEEAILRLYDDEFVEEELDIS